MSGNKVVTLVNNQFINNYLKNIILEKIDPNIEVVNFTDIMSLVTFLKSNYNTIEVILLDINYKNVFDLISAIKNDEDTNYIKIISLIEKGVENQDFLEQVYSSGCHYFLNFKFMNEIEIKSILESAIVDSKRIRLLKRETLYDPLLMIFNRRGLMSAFRNMLYYSQNMLREQIVKIAFVVSIMDIDDFKVVNDNYGHRSGDIYLQSVANAIEITKRSQDILGRYGGEEFCTGMLTTDLNSGIEFLERIRKRIEAIRITTEKQEIIKTTISIGATIAKVEDTSILDVIQRADSALYIAKGKGKNRIEIKIDG